MSAEEQEQYAQELIAKHDLLMVSKSWCPDCVYGKEVFADLGASPHVVELDKMETGPQLQEAFLKITGQNTVPNVFVKQQHIGTEDDIKRMVENGELKKLLEDHQLLMG